MHLYVFSVCRVAWHDIDKSACFVGGVYHLETTDSVCVCACVCTYIRACSCNSVCLYVCVYTYVCAWKNS